MIKVVNGDITKATENMIVHQVNCQGKMGSGVALAIRKAFPRAYVDYKDVWIAANSPEDLLGTVCISHISPEKHVAHLFGQLYYGYDGKRYTSYDALYDGLISVREEAEKNGFSVAIPYGIGSARGGADWDIVYAMINKIFEGYDVTLYKYAEGK